ncbi:MAG: hypothetical protein A2234_03225 [Elusimicrobia bacterium RIFOXYA2_FULL_58_8]|nr:MAG: hypothetical protein A2285_04850 [Elusimicrobia bacterium RIFOXYA12_FULL_57_11]OGS12502.1 MAG: hypothetical protein A2234_03225 [Elusimicrobia bacterium RIFOXYA2_FULL_58_8]
MAKIIRVIVAFSWLVTTGFVVFLTYSTLQTEPNPQALWGWLVMCALTFISATFLAYTTIFGGSHGAHQEED